MKHLLKLADLSQKDILDILNLADQLKYETKHGIEHHSAVRHCSFLTGICRLAEASLLRILQEFFHATLTEL